jgi:nucleoside-diphosphate-sugar epimerase
MKILLTGATGFLGGALARRWVGVGHEVTAITRAASVEKLHALELPQLRHASYVDDNDIANIVAKTQADVIVNTACSYGRAGESISQMLEANLRFGVVLLEHSLKNGGSCKFINTGTVLDPSTNFYALSKWQLTNWGEAVVHANPGRAQFINVLLQHMYGPGDAKSKFTTHVLHSCQDNVPKLDLTAGEQLRDFVYIQDVTNAYNLLINKLADLAPFENVEVGSGVAPSIREFVETAHRLTKSTTSLAFGAVPYRTNEAMVCCADISRMRQLGWAPEFDLDAGLQETINLESRS